MEKVTNNMSEGRDSKQGGENSERWNAWDAVPRDGPAIFLVETKAFDQGQVQGVWIRQHAEQDLQREQLIELSAFTATGQYAVIDQIGLSVMMPEHFSAGEVDELGEIGGAT